ncbi:Pex29p ASCRUDRAFT_77226 [Ascoidea rubescens DSM 1968]|uniref:TECPR1-like DysF domain-containing protein n=1 Tax=Ascoidea rubescens DSM 1968 TaxID=1344418 RepID=A0A1D2VBQ6_9ASCO|nr:hypothetical protein ASCRUDRAFT_77226 [Ascoidea rubescens DSM 1968]ODV59118.1 hypothetical protein ASCRUDRAFT_77226 [Ascoidea rubescens DSM 1968]
MNSVSNFLSSWDSNSNSNNSNNNNNNDSNNDPSVSGLDKPNSRPHSSTFDFSSIYNTITSNNQTLYPNSNNKNSATVDDTQPVPSSTNAQQVSLNNNDNNNNNAKNTNSAVTKNISAANDSNTITNTASKSSFSQQLTDKFMEKLVLMILPPSSEMSESNIQERIKNSKNRPQLTIPLMSKNVILMNQRLSVPFNLIDQVINLINWQNPYKNIFILLISSHIILSPIPTLSSFPFFYIIFVIMIPSYLLKYQIDVKSNLNLLYHYSVSQLSPSISILNSSSTFDPISFPDISYDFLLNSKPIKKPILEKPVPEISKEFYLNLTDLQNHVLLYINTYNFLSELFNSFAFWQNETISSFFVLVLLSIGFFNLFILPKFVPFLIPILKFSTLFLIWSLSILIHPKYRAVFSMFILSNDNHPISNINNMENSNSTITNSNKDNNNDTFNANSNTNVTDNLSNNVNKTKRDSNTIKKFYNKKQKKLIERNFKKFKKNLFIFLKNEFQINLMEILNKNHKNTNNDLKLVEIFELQHYDLFEKEWNSTIYSTDFFTKNSPSRKFKTLEKLNYLKSLNSNNINSFKTDLNLDDNNQPIKPNNYSNDLRLIKPPLGWTFLADKNQLLNDQSNNSNNLKTLKHSKSKSKTSSFLSSKSKNSKSDSTEPTVPIKQPIKAISNSIYNWKLDLSPYKWCNENYILGLVDIDDDEKWCYDTNETTSARSFEFRRRRWVRYVTRVSDYTDEDLIKEFSIRNFDKELEDLEISDEDSEKDSEDSYENSSSDFQSNYDSDEETNDGANIGHDTRKTSSSGSNKELDEKDLNFKFNNLLRSPSSDNTNSNDHKILNNSMTNFDPINYKMHGLVSNNSKVGPASLSRFLANSTNNTSNNYEKNTAFLKNEKKTATSLLLDLFTENSEEPKLPPKNNFNTQLNKNFNKWKKGFTTAYNEVHPINENNKNNNNTN